jgi:hypothetical protein
MARSDSNASHQQAFRERQQAKGLVLMHVWVPADRAEELKDLAGQWREQHELSRADARDVLGVPAGFSSDELTRAWLRYARRHLARKDPVGRRRGRDAFELLRG